MANKLSVAFIGTGIMGAPIAGHILDAGYPVTVNNRTKSKAAALIERGAVWADTPADAVANGSLCDLVSIQMLQINPGHTLSRFHLNFYEF